MVGTFEVVTLLDVSYGHLEHLSLTMLNINAVTANLGSSYRSVRRARSAVVAASLCYQEEGFRDCVSQPALQRHRPYVS